MLPKSVEKKVYSLQFEDGLWDIMLGCVVLMFAIAPGLASKVGDFSYWAISITIWIILAGGILLLKNYLIRPRLGSVRFGKKAVENLSRFSLVMLLGLLITFMAGITAFRHFGDEIVVRIALAAILMFVVLALVAFLFGIQRFLIYGIMIVMSPIIGDWLWLRFGMEGISWTRLVWYHGYNFTFGVSTVLILLVGFTKLVLFLINYRVVKGESL